jgi:hypothetical protein
MMEERRGQKRRVLDLRAGELVEVRSQVEILGTLDEFGRLDALPFMPEMLRFCGQKFRVFKRAEKVCDTIDKSGLRRMKGSVLLEGLRCDGQGHGGCEAACMLFWHEAWLQRVPSLTASQNGAAATAPEPQEVHCTEADLWRLTRRLPDSSTPEDEVFSCQITELKKATSPLPWWDVGQWARDIRSRNVSVWQCLRGVLILIFNEVQRLRGGCGYPHLEQGTLKRTSPGDLSLEPGELVQVKAKEEIARTLDVNGKNRGLWFDPEMVEYSGRTFKVLKRTRKIINEKTGKMLVLSTPSIILDEVICEGRCHKFCARSEYIFWREAWLKRVDSEAEGAARVHQD